MNPVRTEYTGDDPEMDKLLVERRLILAKIK